MIRTIFVMLLSLAGASGESMAQSDITGTFELLDGPVVAPGTVARVRLTTINNGPDATTFPLGMGTVWTEFVGRRTISIFAVPETSPCTIQYLDLNGPPGQPNAVAASIRTAPTGLAAGATASCIFGITTFPETPAEHVFPLAVGGAPGDTTPANDVIYVRIFTGASTYHVVPSSSAAGIGTLLLMLALAGALALRRTGSSSASPD